MSSSQGLPKSFFFFQKFIFARWCLMGCWDADGLLKMGKMGNFSKCLIFFFYFRKAFIVVICCTMNFFSLRILDSNSAPSLFVAVVDLKQSLRKSLFVAVVDLSGCRLWGGRNERVKRNNMLTTLILNFCFQIFILNVFGKYKLCILTFRKHIAVNAK